ncbi:disease resistance protein RML1A [Senna tora]|uniref:Disease resistance protein RML1A n=1 Tax=Senna tora TaxID=362788 RepID=A0A834T5D6_9FABA|nr:disease resistance protein RML1A [Senna tora]
MTSLDLQGTAIKDLPSSIGKMHKLKDFKLRTAVERLPASIKHLPSLKSLYVSDCRSLRCLPELPSSIEEVKAVNCSSLEIVHFTSLRPKMACAQFQNCVKLDVHSIKAMLAKFEASASVMEDEEETLSSNHDYSENSIFRLFPFGLSQLFESNNYYIYVFSSLLNILSRPYGIFFGASHVIKFFNLVFFFSHLLELILELLLVRGFFGFPVRRLQLLNSFAFCRSVLEVLFQVILVIRDFLL